MWTGAALTAVAGAAAVAGWAATRPADGTTARSDYPLGGEPPFAHGVASGDPLADRVIIWTRHTARGRRPRDVDWEMAADPDFHDVVVAGRQQATRRRDWTVKVDVTGLQPGTTYFYRFSRRGKVSEVGRTRTLPEDPEHLRLAALSCSSWWSSYFSGFGHLAERKDIDLVIHLGDYVYDFPDSGELVRSRVGFEDTAHPDNRNWLTLDEVRRRYALWRSDENLRRAHRSHPFFMVWDNHDLTTEGENQLSVPEVNVSRTVTVEDTMRAFWEWTPTRPPKGDASGEWLLVDDHSYPEPETLKYIYRSMRIGDLVEIWAMDAQSGLPEYEIDHDHSHVGSSSLLGRKQYEWLVDGLQAAEKRGTSWKFVLNQAWFTTNGVPDPLESRGVPHLGISRWTDFQSERELLIEQMKTVSNVVMVTGDAHGNLASDVVPDTALEEGYDAGPIGYSDRHGAEPGNLRAGALRRVLQGEHRRQSVAVEFAASSMGRGGVDDTLAKELPGMVKSAGQSVIDLLSDDDRAVLPRELLDSDDDRAAVIALTRVAEAGFLRANYACQYLDWVDHGYGILDVTRKRVVAEFWWQDKRTPDSAEVLGQQLVVWGEEDASADPPRFPHQIDPVSHHGFAVSPTPRADL